MGVDKPVFPQVVLVSCEVRPRVPMSFFTVLPLVAALSLAEHLNAQVAWPNGVVDEQGVQLLYVEARAGADGAGCFARLNVLEGESSVYDTSGLESALNQGITTWEAAVAAGRAQAGPLAPVLEVYFDRLYAANTQVEAVRAGRVIATGTLAGLDVWGRVSLLVEGAELTLAPEQAMLRSCLCS